MNIENTTTKVSCDRASLSKIPTTNGVYIFKRGINILYIGKSVNLKARLLSHFENAKTDAKEHAIIDRSDNIEYVVTDSEFKALLLESTLIQIHKPQYNVRWRDDKSYLYIKINDKDEYPQPELSRKENDGKSIYFGPFATNKTALSILRMLRKIFPFCTSSLNSTVKRPCFYSKIGQCNPCPISIRNMPDSPEKKALKRLYKSNIRKLISVLEGKIDTVEKELEKKINYFSNKQDYESAIKIRNKLKRLTFFVDQRRFFSDMEASINRSEQSMQQLLRLLHVHAPEIEHVTRIECYDVSNTSLKDATASMVVFEQGLANKKEYRRFKIKDKTLQSDFDMMYEVLHRRFNQKWPKPDLLVVDGGKPQVRIARKVLHELGIQIPFIGIAKRPDRIVFATENYPNIRPIKTNLGFQLIQAIRDESHRFAKKYHTYLRNKRIKSNML